MAEEKRRPIYHYRKALERLAETPGLVPRRLFRVMFPLHRVRVRGQERRAEDFEELEWFVIRAIGYGRLDTVPALQSFFGLDERMVRYVVDGLKAIGHLLEDGEGRLTLTRLGRDSLLDERRYEVHESHQILYFDAFTCHPLPRLHYRLRFLTPGELEERDRALYSFEPWRPEALEELAHRPDRAEYNVPDEVQTLEALEVGTAYLPMYIVEAYHHSEGSLLRVFSNVRGRRDTFFESLLSSHPEIVAPLLEDPRPPERTIAEALTKGKRVQGAYRLEQTPAGGWRVVISDGGKEEGQADGTLRLTDLGEYLLVADYCVQIWSEDAAVRFQAACLKALEKLEYIRRDLSPDQVQHLVQAIFSTLAVSPPTVGALITMAREQGKGQALERLTRVAEAGSEGF
ncbi:MAG TPA: hypothetical protein ENK08_00260 [Chloroflexi bacterium]|nr:hypothetical protein [Chloroflexota bacterium]